MDAINNYPVTLWLVRHGQTDWNVEQRFQGHLDVPLNEMGIQQAEEAAKRLADKTFDALFSSDLLRTRQTAEIVARQFNLPVQFDQRLREINHGVWQGLLREDVKQKYPTEFAARKTNPVYAHAPQGESVNDVAVRMASIADELSQRYPNGNVLVISHGMAIATLVCQASHLPLEKAYTLIPENTNLNVIQWPAFTDTVEKLP
jgi:broad specificity phosphatase PhoE